MACYGDSCSSSSNISSSTGDSSSSGRTSSSIGDSIGENVASDSNDTPTRLPWWREARLETNVTESQK
jgi:hypothetical protein